MASPSNTFSSPKSTLIGTSIEIPQSMLKPVILCPLCQSIFTNPCSIRECLHTFCIECIENHFALSEQPTKSCPVCLADLGRTPKIQFDGNIEKLVNLIRPSISDKRGIPDDDEDSNDDDDNIDDNINKSSPSDKVETISVGSTASELTKSSLSSKATSVSNKTQVSGRRTIPAVDPKTSKPQFLNPLTVKLIPTESQSKAFGVSYFTTDSSIRIAQFIDHLSKIQLKPGKIQLYCNGSKLGTGQTLGFAWRFYWAPTHPKQGDIDLLECVYEIK